MSTDIGKARTSHRTRATRALGPALVALAMAVAMLAFVATAGAATHRVSGRLIAVNENAGKYKIRGGLIGRWRITSYKRLATSPIYRAKGTERFNGCLNVHRGPGCAGDPSGRLSFRFRYWARFRSNGSLVWGSCWHPVTGGTGDFAGATGVVAMVDSPTQHGVKTHYTGNVTLGGAPKAQPSAAAGCG
jgi:hypothetical protein